MARITATLFLVLLCALLITGIALWSSISPLEPKEDGRIFTGESMSAISPDGQCRASVSFLWRQPDQLVEVTTRCGEVSTVVLCYRHDAMPGWLRQEENVIKWSEDSQIFEATFNDEINSQHYRVRITYDIKTKDLTSEFSAKISPIQESIQKSSSGVKTQKIMRTELVRQLKQG